MMVKEPLPELININRDLIPDETYVLVGYYKSSEQYEWITNTKKYNLRIGTAAGSLTLDKATVNAKYLLLHTAGDKSSGDLWKINSKGPKVYFKDDLLKKGYPKPSQENYLVVEIEPVTEIEFQNIKWDFTKLKNYSSGWQSAVPFTASLAELMKYKFRSH